MRLFMIFGAQVGDKAARRKSMLSRMRRGCASAGIGDGGSRGGVGSLLLLLLLLLILRLLLVGSSPDGKQD